ncbi:hypothetical protein GSI_04013 [Ganoderma sinense ZZ0214-1]|uniref:Uncharacterized protein n=1 Tax=Ganoderma sinense ZZ0214-1 TaxID=1077348 RepID=A0A2G8SI04_9APHY|nr:hypothetical protein GSI_04013 [Ganoderma sinense ZZ0214-1]
MSNQVRFVHGTKLSDSPAKPFNGNSGHTNTKPDLARNRAELCFNMHGKITIVDYTKFVELFLPPLQDDKTAHVNIFENIPRPKGEPDMYKELLPSASLTRWLKPKAINDAKICPGFKLVANPYQADKTDSSKQAVDLGLYRAKDAPKREKDKPYPAVDWFGLDLIWTPVKRYRADGADGHSHQRGSALSAFSTQRNRRQNNVLSCPIHSLSSHVLVKLKVNIWEVGWKGAM